MLLTAALLLLLGCEKKDAAPSEIAPKLTIKGLIVADSGDQQQRVADAPTEAAARELVLTKLNAPELKRWRWSEGDADGVHLKIDYAFDRVVTEGGQELMLLLLAGSMGTSKGAGGESLPLLCERAIGDAPQAPVEVRRSPTKLLEDGLGECLRDLDQALQIDAASAEELPKLLANKELGVAAIQRGLSRAREERISAAAEPARTLLGHDESRVALAAAATSVALRDEAAAAAMVAAAEQLSRQRAWPELVAMIAHLGDLGGAEPSRYLEALSEGHEQDEIKRLAAEALDRAKKTR
jgi:hypothetical protein